MSDKRVLAVGRFHKGSQHILADIPINRLVDETKEFAAKHGKNYTTNAVEGYVIVTNPGIPRRAVYIDVTRKAETDER